MTIHVHMKVILSKLFPLCRHWRQWRSLFCFCCFYSHLLHTYASPTPTFLLYNRNCIRTHHPLPPSYCTIESSLPYQGHSSHHHPSGTPFTFRDFVSSSFPRTKLAHGATKKNLLHGRKVTFGPDRGFLPTSICFVFRAASIFCGICTHILSTYFI